MKNILFLLSIIFLTVSCNYKGKEITYSEYTKLIKNYEYNDTCNFVKNIEDILYRGEYFTTSTYKNVYDETIEMSIMKEIKDTLFLENYALIDIDKKSFDVRIKKDYKNQEITFLVSDIDDRILDKKIDYDLSDVSYRVKRNFIESKIDSKYKYHVNGRDIYLVSGYELRCEYSSSYIYVHFTPIEIIKKSINKYEQFKTTLQ